MYEICQPEETEKTIFQIANNEGILRKKKKCNRIWIRRYDECHSGFNQQYHFIEQLETLKRQTEEHAYAK
ncbi:hypothetical protein RCL_jg16569.t1 [Rhizophagus clarus]|uniref:Uncharacterized protein n=1 Tax=Rhizophagus clarus TaxID=94130 RepID=A0A8H3QTQ6_9GLOM|nr:hypothetical protein RCL_jg16569.t1 [Rhizophagus clarus]